MGTLPVVRMELELGGGPLHPYSVCSLPAEDAPPEGTLHGGLAVAFLGQEPGGAGSRGARLGAAF